MSSESRSAKRQPSRQRQIVRWTGQTLVLFGVWLAFSGYLYPEFIALGAVAAVAGTATAGWLFHGAGDPRLEHPDRSYARDVRTALRFIRYVPWLTWEVVVSNLHVAYIVLHPKLPVEPALVEFDTSLDSEQSQVLLAQSITLTPGTVTVDASNGKFLVHCLSAKSREGLAEGGIQRKVANVFEESAPDRVALTDIIYFEQVPL